MVRVARIADHTHTRPGLGRRLRQARGGMTMRELGSAAGVSAAYISRIEKDERIPSLQLIYRFADHLHVNRSWLATGEPADQHDEDLQALRRENERLRDLLSEIRARAEDALR
jgi:transcriptional regulator with XRE-family HTH domain